MRNAHAAEMRRCLETCDTEAVVKLWEHVAPHLPAPVDPLAAIHVARTMMSRMPVRLRAYSHRWLIERGLPSHLPDHLKVRAERMYPIVAQAVGVSVNYSNPIMAPVAGAVRAAMEDAVSDAHANKKIGDVDFVKARMMEAKDYALKKLVGRLRV